MNKFLKSNSGLSVLLTLLCALALFNDGANLTDLFSDTTTIHFDEGDGLPACGQSISGGNLTPSLPDFLRSFHQTGISGQRPAMVKRVILDQDSPSLAAVSILSTPAFGLIVDEQKPFHRPVLLGESLYLQNCSLLL
ncbi:MAG TPA: hypothetical protein VES59_00480 [Bacteroidota bacterium]|nr:hypothetical protein [Bacteroidota bacterium]